MEFLLVEGSAFMISNLNGDVLPHTSHGLFYQDTRFLSTFCLTINGSPTELLSGGMVSNYAGSIYATNTTASKIPARTISLIRDRFVGDGVHEDIFLKNESLNLVDLELSLEFDTDFADIFEVKRGAVKKLGKLSLSQDATFPLIFNYERGQLRRSTLISFSHQPEIKHKTAIFKMTLKPKEQWHLCIDIFLSNHKRYHPKCRCGEFDKFLVSNQEHELWQKEFPRLVTDADILKHLFQTSVKDLATLRLDIDGLHLLAAGVPWFMTVFGRDALISALQTLPFSPDLAQATLKVLAKLQGKEVNKFRQEEPGKIIHEIRFGELAFFKQTPHASYYGSVDATPLFLILLGETYRWTGNLELVKELLPAAEAALQWLAKFGDLDADGFVEYQPSGEGGLTNQGWKDSGDSIVFADGQLAKPPIALVEVQGYVYKAKIEMAYLFQQLGLSKRAKVLQKEAEDLKQKFNSYFWLPNEQFFALALDGQKRPVDSITSNPGHCLWCEIIDEEKSKKVVRRLLAKDMFSGWGIRTMSEKMGAYNPISYHNGSVWPHDNALIALGLAKYGFFAEAEKVFWAMVEAASQLPNNRLPELFCGFERRHLSKPVFYPNASAPQAWASGAVFMFLQAVFNFQVNLKKQSIKILPQLTQLKKLKIENLKAFGKSFTVQI